MATTKPIFEKDIPVGASVIMRKYPRNSDDMATYVFGTYFDDLRAVRVLYRKNEHIINFAIEPEDHEKYFPGVVLEADTRHPKIILAKSAGVGSFNHDSSQGSLYISAHQLMFHFPKNDSPVVQLVDFLRSLQDRQIDQLQSEHTLQQQAGLALNLKIVSTLINFVSSEVETHQKDTISLIKREVE
ncbi:MAG: hypothetical protein ABR981_01420 [Candidatus Micrarchaeaceae archaeon]